MTTAAVAARADDLPEVPAKQPPPELIALPRNTYIGVPAVDGAGAYRFILSDSCFLLTRPELERVIVQKADLDACNQSLKACEKRVIAAPARGFFSTPMGHGIVVGGFAVGFSAAFVAGIVLEKSYGK